MAAHLLSNQLLVVVFELLQHVIVVEQLLHCAVVLAKQHLDALTCLLPVTLPEIVVEEAKGFSQ